MRLSRRGLHMLFIGEQTGRTPLAEFIAALSFRLARVRSLDSHRQTYFVLARLLPSQGRRNRSSFSGSGADPASSIRSIPNRTPRLITVARSGPSPLVSPGVRSLRTFPPTREAHGQALDHPHAHHPVQRPRHRRDHRADRQRSGWNRTRWQAVAGFPQGPLSVSIVAKALTREIGEPRAGSGLPFTRSL